MSADDFFFAIEVPHPPPREMIRELTTQVCSRLGCPHEGLPALLDAVQAALVSAGRPDSSCALRFRASGGSLQIAVSTPAGEVWQTSRDI